MNVRYTLTTDRTVILEDGYAVALVDPKRPVETALRIVGLLNLTVRDEEPPAREDLRERMDENTRKSLLDALEEAIDLAEEGWSHLGGDEESIERLREVLKTYDDR